MCMCVCVGAQGETRTKCVTEGTLLEMKLRGSIDVKSRVRSEDIKSSCSTPGQRTHPDKLTSISVTSRHIHPKGRLRSPPASVPWT